MTISLWRCIVAILESTAVDVEAERSLYDGSDWIGDMNHRTHRMDCGMDAGGFYEDDL